MPTTIYKRLNDREFIYSRNDLRKIAYWAHEKYTAENSGKDPDRVDQTEDDKTFSVFQYPDEWIEKIDGITDWYFNKKRKVGENHLKREQRAKVAKIARLKRANNGGEKQQYAQPRNNDGYNKGNNNHNPNQQRKFVKKNIGQNNYLGNNRQNPSNNDPNRPHSYNPRTNYKTGGQNPNRQFKPKDNFNSSRTNPNNSQFRTPYSANNNNRYNNYKQNNQFSGQTNDNRTYNNFENDYQMNNRGFNPLMNRQRGSYYEVPDTNKFTQKVELYSTPDADSSEQPKRRKRIAKALFVAAPSNDNNSGTNE